MSSKSDRNLPRASRSTERQTVSRTVAVDGSRIRIAREAQYFTQEQVAERAKLTKRRLEALEADGVHNVFRGTLRQVATALGMDPAALEALAHSDAASTNPRNEVEALSLATRIATRYKHFTEIEALVQRHPNDGWLMNAYLKTLEQQGTRGQVKWGLQRAKHWVIDHPDDTYVTRIYIALAGRHRASGHIEDILGRFVTLFDVAEHDDDSSVRSAFLGLIGQSRIASDEYVATIIRKTRDWLSHRAEDLHARGAYLGLVAKRGSDPDVALALSETGEWLADAARSDETHVRLAYIGLASRRGNELQRRGVMESTELWLSHHPQDHAVGQAYEGLKRGRMSGKRRKFLHRYRPTELPRTTRSEE